MQHYLCCFYTTSVLNEHSEDRIREGPKKAREDRNCPWEDCTSQWGGRTKPGLTTVRRQ